ncbi:hypothetical protein AMECASPLE_024748 [Ameca splendens]|uniref:Uncharacterized protein n=1 Tax=Ameca splendens TaxID=208324 RepID=A0ABV0ZF55_9TELE
MSGPVLSSAFLLPAVLPQEQPATVRLLMIDRLALNRIGIGSDLKQALPILTECLSPIPSAPQLSRAMRRGTVLCSLWVKNTGSSNYGVRVIATPVCGLMS